MFNTTQPEFTGAASAFPWSQGLEDRYSFMSKFGDPVSMSYRKGNMLYVPRETAPIGKHDGRTKFPPSPAINCKFVPVNEEQGPLVEQSVMLLKQGVSHIFEAPTGFGKSVCLGAIAARMGIPTLIIVNKEDLVDSWKDALINVLGIKPSMVGHVQQDTCDWKGKMFVIGMIHSLVIPDRYPADMYNYFGLMVVDECDTVAADTFVNICWKVPAALRLGCTATTSRSDGKWQMVEGHLGKVRVKGTLVPMIPKVLVKKTGWKIPSYHGNKIPHAPGRLMGVYKAMASSQPRNLMIVDFVLSAYKAGRIILVLSDLTAHLDILFQMLTSAGISGENIGYYIGGMSKIELGHTKKKSVLLGTFKMCDRGTNIPHLDTLVMATPRANVKQPVGRVLRYLKDKKEPVILDLVDHDSIMSGFHGARLKSYYSVGANVVWI